MDLQLVILILILGPALLKMLTELLNRARVSPLLPDEFNDLYDAEKYQQSQLYLRAGSSLAIVREVVDLLVSLGLVFGGGYALLDHGAGALVSGATLPTLVFLLLLSVLQTLIGLPFSWYATFVIESAYGFNRTSGKTFAADQVKGFLLSNVLSLLLVALVMVIFRVAGPWGWLWVWLAVAVVLLLLQVLAPAVILPLFNTFEPLEEGELRNRVEAYAARVDFKLRGVFKVDGSRRSSRGNAFFAGLGRWKRIALFDTIIDRHSVDELECVLAHEMGHFKLKHILKSTIFTLLSLGVMIFLLSRVMLMEELALAAGFTRASFQAGLVAFMILVTPLSLAGRLLGNWFSRRHEFEADAYAVRTTQRPGDMISALKRLTVDNLGNLHPHGLKVALEYSHPPILQRLQALRNMQRGA